MCTGIADIMELGGDWMEEIKRLERIYNQRLARFRAENATLLNAIGMKLFMRWARADIAVKRWGLPSD